MSISKDILETEVRFTTNQAMKELTQLEGATAGLRLENQRLRDLKAEMKIQGKEETKEYKAITAAITSNNKAIKENEEEMVAYRRVAGLAALSHKDLTKVAKDLEKQLKATSKATNPAEYARLEKELGRVHSQMDKVQTGTKKTGGILKGLGKLLPAMGIAAVAAAAGAAVVGLVKNIIAVRSEYEKYEAVLRTSLGSARDARIEMGMLRQFSEETPFQLEQLTGAYVKLVNQGFKPTKEELTKLGDLSSSTGKDFDQLAEALLDAQTGEFERLKEFGIKASKNGDIVKFTFKGVTTEVANSDKAIQQYIIGLGSMEGVTGSMAAISGTLGGRISNLGDAWSNFLNTLGSRSNGIFATAIYWTTQLAKALNWMFTTLDTLRQEGADANYADQLKEEIAQTDELANKIASRGVERGEALKRAVKLQADNMRATIQVYTDEMNAANTADDRKEYLKEQVTFLQEQLKSYEVHYAKKTKADQDDSAKKAKADQESNSKKKMAEKDFTQIVQEAADQRLLVLKDQYYKGEITQKEYEDRQLIEEQRFLSDLIALKKKYGVDATAEELKLKDSLIKNAESSREEFKQMLEDGKKLTGSAWDKALNPNAENPIIDPTNNQELIAHKMLVNAKSNMDLEYAEMQKATDAKMLEIRLNNVDKYGQQAMGAMDVISKFQDAAMNRELKAAGNNTKKKEEIEKKYQEKKRKWAIAQVIIEGIMEVAKIWANVGSTGVGIPIAIAMTAIAVGRTAGEIAVLNSQKFDQGGFTAPGPWDQPQGVVHSDEFVANRYAVRNKSVRPFLDVINMAQRTGQISSLNTDTILRAVESRRGGYASGGYAPPSTSSSPAVISIDPELKVIIAENARAMFEMRAQLAKGFRGDIVLTEFERKQNELNNIRKKTTIS